MPLFYTIKNGKRKYMNREGRLTDDKKDALNVEIEPINYELLRFKIGGKYLLCIKDKLFLSDKKDDYSIFKIDDIWIISINYRYLGFNFYGELSTDLHFHLLYNDTFNDKPNLFLEYETL